jgi:hypothetical protein
LLIKGALLAILFIRYLNEFKTSKKLINTLFSGYTLKGGAAVAQLVGTLRYEPEGRGFDWDFSLT